MNSQSKFVLDNMWLGYKVQDIEFSVKLSPSLLTDGMYQQFLTAVLLIISYMNIISINL